MPPASGIPGAWEIKSLIFDALSKKSSSSVARDVLSDNRMLLQGVGLEAIMYRFVESKYTNVLDALVASIVNVSRPNELHHFFVNVMAKSHIGFTTNFDVLLEVAANSDSININKAIDDTTVGKFLKRDERINSVDLVKIHGCATKRDTIAVTIDAIARGFGKTDLIDALVKVLPEKHALVFGYSGLDRDIMPVISRYHKKVTWIVHSNSATVLFPSYKKIEQYFPKNSLALRLFESSNCDVVIGNTHEILDSIAKSCNFNYKNKNCGVGYDETTLSRELSTILPQHASIFLSKLLHDIGQYRASCLIMEDMDRSGEVDNSDIDALLFWARSMAMQTSREAFTKTKSILARYQPPDAEFDKVKYEALKANIVGYMYDYNFDLDNSEKSRRDALIGLDSLSATTIDRQQLIVLKKIKCDLLLNLANVYFWKGCLLGDNYIPHYMQKSIDNSLYSLELANELNDFINIAKLKENIAHVTFKKYIGLGCTTVELNDFFTQIYKMRLEALDLIDFLNDDRMRYHSIKNLTFELIHLNKLDEAYKKSIELLSIAHRMNWVFAFGVAQERLGDIASRVNSNDIAVYHWVSARKAYKKSSVAEYYVNNIAYKIKNIKHRAA